DGGPPAAALNIDEAGYVSRSDLEAECVAFDRRAIDELIVRPHRGHSRKFVDGDLWRRIGRTHDRKERDRGIVAARLARSRLAALGVQVQRGIAAGRSGDAEREPTVGTGPCLPELLRITRRRRPERHGRIGYGGTGTKHLTGEAGGTVRLSAQQEVLPA